MKAPTSKTLHPDSKGRIALGLLAKGISSFQVTSDKNGRIILEPFVEIPAREQWLFKNPSVLKQIQSGLEDSGTGRVSERGDFSGYINGENE